MKELSIGVLPGDGIGPEVIAQAVRVLEAVANIIPETHLTYEILPVGLEAFERYGTTFPEITRERLKYHDACLLGPLSTHLYTAPGMINVSTYLRKNRALYANIRPIKSYSGIPSVHKDVDLVIVRENTEGFYADRNLLDGNGELRIDEDTVISVRVITRRASQKVAKTAFRLAQRRNRKRLVTAAHKANVLRKGCGLFLEACRAVHEEYPDVQFSDTYHIDALAMQLVMHPQAFDVIVATNLFGDILSDLTAGLVGGLGLAPGLNAGDDYAVAQAVHGSAPDIAGKGIANPCAEILSLALLLDWLAEKKNCPDVNIASQAIMRAVETVLEVGQVLTPDLGGKASTVEFGDAVVQALCD